MVAKRQSCQLLQEKSCKIIEIVAGRLERWFWQIGVANTTDLEIELNKASREKSWRKVKFQPRWCDYSWGVSWWFCIWAGWVDPDPDKCIALLGFGDWSLWKGCACGQRFGSQLHEDIFFNLWRGKKWLWEQIQTGKGAGWNYRTTE